MQSSTQKTNQRMPGRSAQVIGSDLGQTKPPQASDDAAKPAVTPKPVIKLSKKQQ
jgi:hypothetical protein